MTVNSHLAGHEFSVGLDMASADFSQVNQAFLELEDALGVAAAGVPDERKAAVEASIKNLFHALGSLRFKACVTTKGEAND